MNNFIYLEMKQISKGNKDKVLKLKKTFYGLKQVQEHEMLELTNIYIKEVSLSFLMSMCSTLKFKIMIY